MYKYTLYLFVYIAPPGNTIAVSEGVCGIQNQDLNTYDVCEKQMHVTFVVEQHNSTEGRRGSVSMKK